MSDIDTAVVDGLKALDPKRPIREADIAPRLIDAGDPFRPKGGYTSPHAPHCANPMFLIWLIAKPDSLVLDIGRRQWDGVTSVGRFWRQSRALFLPYGQRLFRPQSHVAS